MNEKPPRTEIDPANPAVGLVAFALSAEAALRRMARGGGLLDLALGEVLDALATSGGLMRLGYARITDYAREKLDVPASTALGWMRLARVLRGRPILRRAVRVGLVTPRKAILVSGVAKDEDEEPWTAAAASLTEKKLRRLVEEDGGTVPEEWITARLDVLMTTGQRDRFDVSIAFARGVLGPDRPRWQFFEAFAMEFMSSHAEWIPDDAGPARETTPSPDPDRLRAWRERCGDLRRQIEALVDADALVEDAEVLAAEGPFVLDERIHRLLRARRGFDGPLGRQAALVRELRAWRYVGCETWEEYCREWLGLTARSLQQRIWLERRLDRLPALRKALEAGLVKYTQAIVVARGATAADVEQWIERVRNTTVQQGEREARASEDAKDRRTGICRVWSESDALVTIRLGILCAQAFYAAHGERIGEGEALARMGEHFVATWSEDEKRRRRKIGASRLRVLERTGGLCAVPGCSRPAEHEHHVRFRSRGGGEEEWNRCPTCDLHHLFGVHGGSISVEGRAGDRLVWRFHGTGDGDEEVWVTRGDDDVRRAGSRARTSRSPAG